MSTQTRFEEDSSVDLGRLGAWQPKVIRSHRRAPSYSSKRITGLALAITITATGLSASVTDTAIPAVASAGVSANAPILDYPTIVLPQLPEAVAERNAHAATLSRGTGRSSRGALPEVSRIETVIRFALAQQGDRYVWASSGPNTYDCSGLVLRAFAQIGITLPHFTGTMISKGVKVSRAGLQRGDVIFPTSGHVGIYLGDGQMVHASSGKGRVAVTSMYSFYAARRLV